MTATFKDGTGDFASRSGCHGFSSCGELFGVSPAIFALYSNDLSSEA